MRSLTISVLLLASGLIMGVACGETAKDTELQERPSTSPTVQQGPTTEVPENSRAPRISFRAEFDLPAADAFGQPGFHEVLAAMLQLPQDLSSTDGMRLVHKLRDTSRPDVTCSRDHPLSGCATVDWSDSPSRPNVPPGDVFDNNITLQTASGERAFFLSESGGLRDEPDDFDPG